MDSPYGHESVSLAAALSVQLFSASEDDARRVALTAGMATVGLPDILCLSSTEASAYRLVDADLNALLLSVAERLRANQLELGVPFTQHWDRGATLARITVTEAHRGWADSLGRPGEPLLQVTWDTTPDPHGSGMEAAGRLVALWTNEFPNVELPALPPHVHPFGLTTPLVLGLRHAVSVARPVQLGMTVALTTVGDGWLSDLFARLDETLPAARDTLDAAWSAGMEDSRRFAGLDVGGQALPPTATSLVWPLAAGYAAWAAADRIAEAQFWSLFGPLEIAVAQAASFDRLLAASPQAARLFEWQSRLSFEQAIDLGQRAREGGHGPTNHHVAWARVQGLRHVAATGLGAVSGNDVLLHLVAELEAGEHSTGEAAICLIADAILAAALRDIGGSFADARELANQLDDCFRTLTAG